MDIHEYLRERGVSEAEVERARQATEEKVRAYTLAQARKRCDLTQRDVASRMGVSQKRISQLERGDIGSARIDTLRRYAEGIGGTLVACVELPDEVIRLV